MGGPRQSVILQAYGMDKTVIFTTLLILVAVRATEVEQRVENERLRAEIHSLRAMNGHLLAKTKALQLENNDLRAQLAMPAADNDKALDLRDEMMDESMVATLGLTNEGTCADGKEPSEHCQANCKIKTLDADCFITTSVLGMIKSRFRPTGTSDHPRWSFNYTTSEFGVSPPELEEVTVECPCSAADGQTLDQETALRNILGQVAAIGIPKVIAERVASGTTRSDAFMSQMGYAVVKMMSCWATNCRGSQNFNLLETGFGGGAMC